MLEVLYFIGIFPIQTLLEGILSLFHTLTQSYGLSFILLSFSIQIFLLKLLRFFEHKAKAFNALKQNVNTKREEFKKVFKGAELMSYTQILYKQRGFHPLFAFFSLGGLALQIPLFIALIILVSEAEFLKGVGFLWISDLSKPDVFMGMQSMQALASHTQEASSFMLFNHPFTFHLLPFIMCLLSLGSVWIYTQDRGEVIQGIALSLLFLVLLYNMPSALVLYWSSNMLFTLLKGLWWRVREAQNKRQEKELENLEYPKEDGGSKGRLELQGGLENLKEKEEGRGYEGLQRRNLESNRLDSKLNASSLENLDSKLKRESHLRIGLRDGESGSNQRGQNLESKENLHPLKPQSRFSRVWRNIFTPHNELKTDEYKTYKHISILAIINICFMICVFSPFAVYSSDVSQFDPAQTYQTLGALFGVFILSSVLLIYLTSFFYKSRLLKLGAYGMSVILLIGVVYTFVLTGDYGVMDHFVLQNPSFGEAETRMGRSIRTLLVSIGCALFAFFLWGRLKILFMICFTTLSILSVINFYTIVNNMQYYITPSSVDSPTDTLQPYEKELFSYSKTQKNIVVFMLDMFSGSHMDSILKQFPEFRTKLDGFTLFNNSTSTASFTTPSIASIIGGEYYSAYNMNERKKNLSSSIAEAFGVIGDTFVKNGYDVAYFMSTIPSLKTRQDIQSYNQDIFVTQDGALYRDYYVQNKEFLPEYVSMLEEQSKDTTLEKLLSVGLFRFVPDFFFRVRVYYSWYWFLDIVQRQKYLDAILSDSSMYAFTTLHNTESQKPTFKYLDAPITHSPFGLYYDGGKCIYSETQSVWDDYPQEKTMDYGDDEKWVMFQHYDSELCALSYLNDYIQWLKSEGIYDNTQIFVVSDHGGFGAIDIPHFLIMNKHRPDTLLLFKDFNTKGELQIDSRLMMNYDASSIFCENLPSGCPNVPANVLKNYPENRSVISTIIYPFLFNRQKSNEWNLNHIYRVQGSIYDEKSWQDITQEVKEGKLKFGGVNH